MFVYKPQEHSEKSGEFYFSIVFSDPSVHLMDQKIQLKNKTAVSAFSSPVFIDIDFEFLKMHKSAFIR